MAGLALGDCGMGLRDVGFRVQGLLEVPRTCRRRPTEKVMEHETETAIM